MIRQVGDIVYTLTQKPVKNTTCGYDATVRCAFRHINKFRSRLSMRL